jgi:DMSO/TMAO reductase YedYZ molybdopterin-dependent catalytic subunit
VENPASYTLDQLTAMPRARLVKDVQCVTGWRVLQTEFAGVRLSRLPGAVTLKPGAKALRFTCFDGAQQGPRRDDQAQLAARQQPGQRGQHRPVSPRQPGRPYLPLEDGDLVTQDQNPGVLARSKRASKAGQPNTRSTTR